MNGLDLDDLPRRLTDLADSAGPWDDPMPEVRRRAALATSADRQSPDASADAQSPDAPADAQSPAAPPVRARPSALRAKRRWRWPDPFAIASVAAVLLLVVGLGWLIHNGGGDGGSKKSATDAQASQASGGTSAAAAGAATTSSAAAMSAAGSAPRASASASVSAPAPAPVPVARCGIPAGSSALSLRAPVTVRTGAAFPVRVRLAAGVAGPVQSQVIVAVAQGRVVGRLVPTGTKAGPAAAETVVTGTLRASTCGQVTPKPGSAAPRTLPGKALAPGRYQLIVVVTSARAVEASAPLAVTVTP